MLEKSYQPGEVETRIYSAWEEQGAFKAGPPDRIGSETYCIVIPPPNVTGSLHMGHAFNTILQDLLIRFERMRGKDVLWQPGTDHAGIATQMVVERQLAENGEPGRRDMSRDEFIERIWSWKEESGGTIISQLKRLGASCDWSRERFTMGEKGKADDQMVKSVIKVFVELHKQGLIYKDKRLVNWDPKLLTAISDLEVVPTETNGHMWHFKYPVKGLKNKFITVATTRPETMLGDSAVAVHPDDPRYKKLIGKMVVLPLVGREIEIIADEYADPEQGSGAVKITPAHDFNDFEVGRRNDLELINIFDEHACLNENVPEVYRGMDRFEARKKIVADLDAEGLLAKVEEHTLQVPYGDRSNVVIEPWLTDQWYVNAAELAKPAIKAIEDGDTRFVPKNWEKTYFEWMRNIQPWCISRQLWWGHRIPAWYGPDGEIFVAEDEKAVQLLAKKHYGKKKFELTQDPDVLDTWFSSALWPFSTLGWPEDTDELKRYYPTSVLVTGFDIIFFWVARMMMMGLKFQDQIPIETIYIHALVRDEHGAKMSKSKGNSVDPLGVIDEFGADALRFTLAAMAAPGTDIKLASSRIEGYRNFATKLWNAARFSEMNECTRVEGFDPKSASQTVNLWIAGETARALSAVEDGIEAYRFNDAASAAYHFVWHIFCDWYLELIKPILYGSDEEAKVETRAMTAWTFDQILKILHPFMPFITEELWTRIAEHGPAREQMLILSRWPELEGLGDKSADEEIDWIIRLTTEIRSVRAEMNVAAGMKIPVEIIGADKRTIERIKRHDETIKQIARLDSILISAEIPKGAIQLILDEATIALPLKGLVDISAETERLRREIDKADDEIAKIDGKLGNKKFIERAPAHVVEEQRQRKNENETTIAKLNDALKRLESAM